ncbi:MAG: hypothetical protein CMH52_08405 [Myxococcales bacterium]|nr:hypothetical protein [Myxococcales bacterium]|tara:strand:- start:217 stop:993 length:777 start_codon:yes stop_codon:yes gene_type:complete
MSQSLDPVSVFASDLIECELTSGVMTVCWRVDRITWRGLNEFRHICGLIDADARVQVAVLKNRGPDFSHGVDLSDNELVEAVAMDGGKTVAEVGAEAVHAWANLSVCTIAALDGYVVGGGACLAMASDFRCATQSSTVWFPEIDRGMYLSWGIIPRLIQEVGLSMARRMAILGEPIPTTDFSDNVFQIVDDLDQAVHGLTQQLLAKPRDAAGLIKQAFLDQCRAVDGFAAKDVERFIQSIDSQAFAALMSAWLDGRKR